nr:MAG TPA: hypothetical protein [Caudoviricetes sp.]
MKNVYVIRVKGKDEWLTDEYYKPSSKKSPFLKDAHKFGAFELLLATKTILRDKNKYIVYKYFEKQEGEVILSEKND